MFLFSFCLQQFFHQGSILYLLPLSVCHSHKMYSISHLHIVLSIDKTKMIDILITHGDSIQTFSHLLTERQTVNVNVNV